MGEMFALSIEPKYQRSGHGIFFKGNKLIIEAGK